MKILIQIAFLLLIFNSTDTLSRERLIDNKDICERYRGVWREFGNSCADNCHTKIKTIYNCASSIVFNCDCGENKCWDIDRCTTIKRYKIEAERRLQRKKEEEERRLEEMRKMEEAAQELLKKENEKEE